MAFFLGLDAGGPKTDYVLADETHELARARTGTIKRLRADSGTATVSLEQGLAELTAKTGISMQSITRTCIGHRRNIRAPDSRLAPRILCRQSLRQVTPQNQGPNPHDLSVP
jgi:N-acetylglucosamine kinase-like BadF-type ATPase